MSQPRVDPWLVSRDRLCLILFRFFSQGALNVTKQRDRINKSTFNKIICLKSYGIFKDEDEDEDEKDENQDIMSSFIIDN